MSKSYGNTINIFEDEKTLLKNIKRIQSKNQPIEEPMDYNNCNVFKIFKTIASKEDISRMKENYQRGNFGYMKAKTILFEAILDKFRQQRNKFNHLIKNHSILDKELNKGKEKAKKNCSPKNKTH